MMNLFLQPAEYQTAKHASAEVVLSDDANSWSQEILQEVYKQVPYVSDFDPAIVMDRTDAERGYALGHVEIKNKTEAAFGTNQSNLQSAGIQTVRLPIIVSNKKLQPLDIIVNSTTKLTPLTEPRLRQALFRPQAFDVTSKTPGDMSMIGQLYPPYRQNYGFGGGGVSMSAGMGKQGSDQHFADKLQTILGLSPEETQKLKTQSTKPVKLQDLGKTGAAGVPNSTVLPQNLTKSVKTLQKTGSILEAIRSSIYEADYLSFYDTYKDEGIKVACLQNLEALGPALHKLKDIELSTVEKRAHKIPENIRPDVVQITKLASGYKVKTARHDYWEPFAYEQNRGEVVKNFGEKVVLAVDLSGSVTISNGPDVKEEPELPKAELVTKSGFYKVKDSTGKELVGYVFPNLVDMDGTHLPISLFTNGSQTTLASEIYGEPAGDGKNPPKAQPSGYGLFYYYVDGEIQVTIPMSIIGKVKGKNPGVQAELYNGRKVFLHLGSNVQKLTPTGDGAVLLPAQVSWMPLSADGSVVLSGPSKKKEAAALRSLASVTVRTLGGNDISISGPTISKLGYDDTVSMDMDEAMFLFSGLGTDLTYAQEKIAESLYHSRPVEVRIGRLIKTAEEARSIAMDTANKKLASKAILREELWKEAAFVPDPTAVDTILSIGFINPENIATFVEHIPVLEQSQSILCELLLASRLGLKQVPTQALEKCIKSLENVLDGLKVLTFQTN